MEPFMQLALVSEQPGQNSEIIRAAGQAGWTLACESDYERMPGMLAGLHVDAVVMMARRVDDRVMQAIRTFNTTCPLPVVLFTEDSMQASIRAAVSGGVSAYVVDCTKVERIGALLEIAVVRFGENQQLKRELHKAKTSLAERTQVEKAKGIIMRQRNINEEAAYRILRKLAMDRNRRIGEVAGEIIAVADVLI
jgi:response regulator NasT